MRADESALEQPVPSFLTRELIALFEAGRYPSEKGHNEGAIEYRLFKPSITEPGRTFPMIVLLHGTGTDELNHRNIGQLKYVQSLVFRDPKRPEQYPFFFLAPQLPEGGSWYTLQGLEAIIVLVNKLQDTYPIDPDRVTLIGISAGGAAAWEMAARNPDTFAAVAPMASEGMDPASLKNLIQVPVWAFHSSEDKPENERAVIERLSAIGGCCRITEIPGKDHNCWNAAFAEYGLLQWLLEQKRGSACSLIDNTPWPERFASWLRSFWPQLLTGMILVCGILLWRREIRSRRELPQVFADDAKSNM